MGRSDGDAPRAGAPSALVLLGHPVAHSLSPLFQQAALDAAGLAVRYTARDTPPALLAATLHDLARARAGGNVTIPHKEAVYAACRHRTPTAERTGAVNTFWHDESGALVGHNTDVAGVTVAIRTVLGASSPPALRVALLGAGGAAASVVAALTDLDVPELRIVARTRARAEALAARFPGTARVMDDAESAVREADLVINATPVGLSDDALPLAPHALAPRAAVLDLVCRRGETAWVRACRARGHRAEDGLRMLVEQGAEAFTCWFGMAPDRGVMWQALESRPFGGAP